MFNKCCIAQANMILFREHLVSDIDYFIKYYNWGMSYQEILFMVTHCYHVLVLNDYCFWYFKKYIITVFSSVYMTIEIQKINIRLLIINFITWIYHFNISNHSLITFGKNMNLTFNLPSLINFIIFYLYESILSIW